MSIEGLKFGKLTAVKFVGKSKRGDIYYCECDCGGHKEVAKKELLSGNNKSCGCLRHNMFGTRPFHIWGNMKKRCDNSNSPDYKRYGGRGISYPDKWSTFQGFWEDMKEGYSDQLTLDRIDNNKSYSKDNCRWADYITQSNNRRSNRFVYFRGEKLTLAEIARKLNVNFNSLKTRYYKGLDMEEAVKISQKETMEYKGETKTVTDWAEEYGMTYHQLKKRLMRGWDIERALTQPLRKR